MSTTTSAKTLMQIVAASNHKSLIDEISISFQGTSNTAAPILIELIRQSDAGTMTSLTLLKDPDDWDETIQTTANKDASAEPTGTTVIKSLYVHPQTGWDWQAPFGKAIAVGGGDRVGLRVTAGASVNATVSMSGEE